MNCPAPQSFRTRVNRFIALLIFLVAITLYSLTAQSSVAYWDCAEYAATSPTLEVPHPPGAPLFTLLTRLASMVPVVKDVAMRMNLVSAFVSALAIMFLYLIAVRVISRWEASSRKLSSAMSTYVPAAIGALTLAVSDTFWFNAVESGLFASSIFFISMIVWLGLVWFDESETLAGDRYLLLAAYLLGLSSGVHQLCLLAYFPVALLVYFKFHEFRLKSFLGFCIIASLGFFVIYPGIVKWLVAMLSGNWSVGPLKFSESPIVQIFPPALIIAAMYGIWKSAKRKNRLVGTILTAGLLVIGGYSTYTLIYLRANSKPPINENNPATVQNLESYLDRAQYGSQPVFWPRRWNPDPKCQENYSKYKSDLDFFWSYQVNHMYLRYLGFNFVGRASDIQDAPVAFFTVPKSWHDPESGFPVRYFAIPLLLGLFGIWYHFKRDWKLALVFLAMFVVMGLALTVYFNMADPQPRERDYFFVSSFLVFALWIAVGTSGIVQSVFHYGRAGEFKSLVAAITAASIFVVTPLNMFRENLFSHNRHDNYAPLDVSYDILQSCPRNAILFTGGDNDTFPLWYLQETCGIRTDIRVICLSLANTDWYLLQLKNETPHGAERVPFTFTDQQIKEIANAGAIEWKPKTLRLEVPPAVYKDFNPQVESQPGFIEYTIDPTVGSGNVRGLRTQDIMVNNIVTANDWRRPICFGTGVPPYDCIGLQRYFMRQGLVYVLSPYADDSQYIQQINEPAMRQCLFHDTEVPRPQQEYGFMFNGLDRRGIYYDSNTRNMIYTLRDSFITLAGYYQIHNENTRCAATLDTMELRVPVETVAADYPLLGYIARLYFACGEKAKFLKFSSIAESEALQAIRENPRDLSDSYNPYSVLLGLYEMGKEYNNELALLEKLHDMLPDDSGIDRAITAIRDLVKERGKNSASDTVENNPSGRW